MEPHREHSQKAFTADKLKKLGLSGARESDSGDAAAKADDFGRKAAHASDAPMAFASGGAAKAPSLGRASRANGGRASNRPTLSLARLKPSQEGGNVSGKIPDIEGGKPRNISAVSDGGPRSYGERPLIIGKGSGGNSDEPDLPQSKRASGGRVNRAKGGRAKGKTVVNVIVGARDKNQPPAPMAAAGPMPPPIPPPPPAAAQRPPMMPPGAGGGAPVTNIMPSGAAPMGAAGAPPGGGQIPPGLLGRARGGRISEKYGAGSGLGRMERAKRQSHGKVELPEKAG